MSGGAVELVGLLPVAGSGARFPRGDEPKLLHPVRAPDGGWEPLYRASLRQLENAGVARTVAVVRGGDDPVAAHVGGIVGIETVVQSRPAGLPDAVSLAAGQLGSAAVLLVLADTLVMPLDAGARLVARLVSTSSDLVLGVFPTDEPERLGPVVLDGDGKVRAILDKPAASPVANTWGMAAWSGRFTAFCRDWEASRPKGREAVLGDVFSAALVGGLGVAAVSFVDGSFFDLGTAEALRIATERGWCRRVGSS